VHNDVGNRILFGTVGGNVFLRRRYSILVQLVILSINVPTVEVGPDMPCELVGQSLFADAALQQLVLLSEEFLQCR
jgi:hypothetical protein